MKLYLIEFFVVVFLLNGCVYDKLRSNIYIKPELAIKKFEDISDAKLTTKYEDALVIQMRTTYHGRIPYWTGIRFVELLVLIKNFDYTTVDKIYKIGGKEASYNNSFYEHKGIEFEKISGKVKVKKIGEDFIRFHLLLSLISEDKKVKKINKTITFKKGEIYFVPRDRAFWASGDEKIHTAYPKDMLKFLLDNDVYEVHK